MRESCMYGTERGARGNSRPYRTRSSFIARRGSAAAAGPLAARAQQSERMRRIGMLMNTAADDMVFQTRVGAFLQGLALLGWTIGRNVRIEVRWSGGKADEARRYATE